MLERGEVEIGVTDFYATSERAEVSDLSVILDYAEYERIAFGNSFILCYMSKDLTYIELFCTHLSV